VEPTQQYFGNRGARCCKNPWTKASASADVRVARWNIFKPKILIRVILEGLAMEDVGIIHGHLVYITII
jgi:hypothetical protein